MALLNPGGAIAQFQRNDRSIPPVEVISRSGVRNLLDNHPGTSFELQLGVSSGYDIQSHDGCIVAECFAVTTVYSNRKLEKDCKKLTSSNAAEKYIYFYSHLDSAEKLQKQFDKYPDITFRRVTFSKTSQTSTHS